jgi:hypothetical protein
MGLVLRAFRDELAPRSGRGLQDGAGGGPGGLARGRHRLERLDRRRAESERVRAIAGAYLAQRPELDASIALTAMATTETSRVLGMVTAGE